MLKLIWSVRENFLKFTRETKLASRSLWNFSCPSGTRNFKIGFSKPILSPLWTWENFPLTLHISFLTAQRENIKNKVLLSISEIMLLSVKNQLVSVSYFSNIWPVVPYKVFLINPYKVYCYWICNNSFDIIHFPSVQRIFFRK